VKVRSNCYADTSTIACFNEADILGEMRDLGLSDED
jgi:hypothetical protein